MLVVVDSVEDVGGGERERNGRRAKKAKNYKRK